MINPNTYVKPSAIHGVGLFALTNIKVGEEIIHGVPNYDDFKDEWLNYAYKQIEVSLMLKIGGCCINHSEFPNCKRKGNIDKDISVILSTRLILKNEEILEDYHQMPDWNNPFSKNHVSAVVQKAIEDMDSYNKKSHKF